MGKLPSKQIPYSPESEEKYEAITMPGFALLLEQSNAGQQEERYVLPSLFGK